MLKGIYNTAASMVPRLRKQEVIANNLANAETAGYKKDSLFLRVFKKEQGISAKLIQPSWEVRMIDKIYTDYSGGALEATGRDLDLALQSDGFFAVLTPNGEAYTRNGAFTLGADGTLTSSDGYPVLGDGGPIVLTQDKVAVGNDGQLMVDGQTIGKLRIVDFEDPLQLQKTSGTLYTTDGATTPITPANVNVRQGYLERSNVDILKEMVDMIDTYRMFETGQKMIQIQDDTLGKAVSELPRV